MPPCPSTGSTRRRSHRAFGELGHALALRRRAFRPNAAVDDLEVAWLDLHLLGRVPQELLARPRRQPGRHGRARRSDDAPALDGDRGALSVSAAMTLTFDRSMPKASAAIVANPVATPVMSTTPVMIVIVPSASRRHMAAAGCDAGHTPIPTPTLRPSAGSPFRARADGSGPCGAPLRRRSVPSSRHRPSRRPADGVAAAQLDGIDPELRRELVDQRFEHERRLRATWAAIRARPDAVRLDAVGADVEGVPAIRAGDEDRSDPIEGPLGTGADRRPSALEASQWPSRSGPRVDLVDRARAGFLSSRNPRDE